jgi:hypothetical protein
VVRELEKWACSFGYYHWKDMPCTLRMEDHEPGVDVPTAAQIGDAEHGGFEKLRSGVAAAVRAEAVLPIDARDRKSAPVVTGLLDYFPAALVEVARVSKIGNDQHNPGEPLHDARGKSNDDEDCLLRHLIDRGTLDSDGMRHSAKVAWRALRMLQKELEAAGAPKARGAK